VHSEFVSALKPGRHMSCAGVCSFEDLIRGRDVVIWSDNSGAEHAVAKGAVFCFLVALILRLPSTRSLRAGTTRNFDHCCLVHALWKHFVELGVQAFVKRVPTAENVADNPSRHAVLAGPLQVGMFVFFYCWQGILQHPQETRSQENLASSTQAVSRCTDMARPFPA